MPRLQWTLPELRRVKQPKAVGEQQGMVVEPPLVSHLEDRISAMCRAGDARWTALLGQWLVGVGVLRYKHLNLSTVLKITPSTVHCFCTKGKQAKLRRGFYWCVPATFSNSFAWTKPWVDQFQLLSLSGRSTAAWFLTCEVAPGLGLSRCARPRTNSEPSWRSHLCSLATRGGGLEPP